MAERKVARFEPLEVAEHLRLAVVAVEDVVLEERAGAGEGCGDGDFGIGGQLGHGPCDGFAAVQDDEDFGHVGFAGGLVQRDADGVRVEDAEVDLVRFGELGDVDRAFAAQADGKRVEEQVGRHLEVEALQSFGQGGRQQVDAMGDLLQAFRPVIDGIHRGHVGEKRLGGADVRRGLLAADVLLAGAERKAHGGFAGGVLGHADEAAGHLAFEGVARGEETRVRPAVAQRHTETLGAADADIRAEFAGRTQDGQREQVGRDHDHRAGGVGLVGQGLVVHDGTESIRILDEDAGDLVVELELRGIDDLDLDAERLRAGSDDVDRLGMAVVGDQEDVPAFLGRQAEMERFGGSGALVEQGGVGDLKTGQVADHGLEIEERFQTALGDFGLVGRVLRIPAGVFKDVALDDGRRDAVVVTEADVGTANGVLGRDGLELLQHVELGFRGGDRKGIARADDGRDGCVDHGVDGIVAERFKHAGRLRGARADVAVHEAVWVREGI